MKDVRGKVAFITGGASGIGLGIAQALADAGAKVILADRDYEHAIESARAIGADTAIGVALDVADHAAWPGAIDLAIAKFGGIDILVGNAGVMGVPDRPIEDLSEPEWRWLMGINTDGVYNGVNQLLPHIKARRSGGHIVTTASTAALCVSGRFPEYNASKFAALGFSLALREQLAPYDIGVTTLCPAYVRTGLAESTFRSQPDGPRKAPITANFARNIRNGMDPRDVGEMVLAGIIEDRAIIFSNPDMGDFIRQGWSRIEEDLTWSAATKERVRAAND